MLPSLARATPPWRSTFHASRITRESMQKSECLTLKAVPRSTVTTSSRTGLKKSTKDYEVTYLNQKIVVHVLMKSKALPTKHQPHSQSIGLLLGTSNQSKIKANAVLAGLSLPLAQLSRPTPSLWVSPTFTTSLSNNKYLATPSVQAATEEISTVHLLILPATLKNWIRTTPTFRGQLKNLKSVPMSDS